MFCKKCKQEIPDVSTFCLFCGAAQIRLKTKRRRTKGLGTVYRIKRKKNPWRAETNGKYIGVYPTKEQAEQALKNYTFSDYSDKLNSTLQDIYEKWSKNHYAEMTKGGRQALEAAWNFLIPIAHSKMRDLTLTDYQRIIDNCDKKRATKAKIKQLIGHLCKYAIADNIIAKNFADYIKMPKDDTINKDIFTQEQAFLIYRAAETDFRATIILLLICTGLRIGELCDTLRVNVYHLNNPPYLIAGSKTEAGRDRTVPILPIIHDYISDLMNDNSSSPYLVHHPDGRKMSTKYVRDKCFKSCLMELGILTSENMHSLTPHSCRHTFATIAAQKGVAPEALQQIMGHADYSTTVDNYINQSDIDYLFSELLKFS